MKKAKFMLMAILVMGVVGGALAFKASKFTTHTLYTCATTATTTSLICVTAPYGTITGTIVAGITAHLYTTWQTSAVPVNCSTTTTINGVPTTVYCTVHPLTAYLNF